MAGTYTLLFQKVAFETNGKILVIKSQQIVLNFKTPRCVFVNESFTRNHIRIQINNNETMFVRN